MSSTSWLSPSAPRAEVKLQHKRRLDAIHGGGKIGAIVEHKNDPRVVLTLDAGGTKFSFSAMAGGEQIVAPLEYPSHADNLELCLKNIFTGFAEVLGQIHQKPAAISFAFPGPSHYPEGVIGDLGNLPAFRGGIPLGPMLAQKFGVPVFINNDGDLFTLGEALGGLLPEINQALELAGSGKRYRNLVGFTLGTGLGGGIVQDTRLFAGDNSAAGEVWLMRNGKHPHTFIEESVSIRAVQRVYHENSGGSSEDLTAREIFDIAQGNKAGDKSAAIAAFAELGAALGDCIANVVTLIDGLVVLGGGLSNAYPLFAPAMMRSLGEAIDNYDKSRRVSRLELSAFDLENMAERQAFLKGGMKTIAIPGSAEKITLDILKRTGIGRTRLGTSKAVALGAYVFALEKLKNMDE